MLIFVHEYFYALGSVLIMSGVIFVRDQHDCSWSLNGEINGWSRK